MASLIIFYWLCYGKSKSILDEAISIQVSALLLVKHAAVVDIQLAAHLSVFQSEADVVAMRDASTMALQRLAREKTVINAASLGLNGIKQMLDAIKSAENNDSKLGKLKNLAASTSIAVVGN